MVFALAFATIVAVAALILFVSAAAVFVLLFGRQRYRRELLTFACLSPVVSLCWIAVVMGASGFINMALLGKSVIGDSFYCPLPNGYVVDLVDTTDRGRLRRVNEDWEAISGVVELQLHDSLMYGVADNHVWPSGQDVQSHPSVGYFRIDTTTGRVDWSRSPAELLDAISSDVKDLRLEPIGDVYWRYRFTWFDYASIAVALLPPLSVAIFFPFAVWYSRRHSVPIPRPVM